jgi:hypothetical protein
MKLFIGVWSQDVRRNRRTGKIHIAEGGVGKAFCGTRSTNIESGDWMDLREFEQGGEVCERCLLIAKSK